jgi:hypothetical protein
MRCAGQAALRELKVYRNHACENNRPRDSRLRRNLGHFHPKDPVLPIAPMEKAYGFLLTDLTSSNSITLCFELALLSLVSATLPPPPRDVPGDSCETVVAVRSAARPPSAFYISESSTSSFLY